MKKLLVPFLAIAVLAACAEQDAPAPGTDSATPAAGSAEAPETGGTKGRAIPQPLAEGVVLDFPHHFRSQRVVDADDGNQERHLTVEYLTGDVASTAQALRDSMGRAGFRAAAERPLDNDRLRLVFRKKGFGRVTAVVAPLDGLKPRNASARGVVQMVWPEPAA